jgi:DNA-binding GntR family transcriptional regulator
MNTALVGDLRIRRQSLHDVVVDRLRDLIVEGVLAPGQRLNERLLSAQLGVSRTPLRESFKVLAAEGLVEILPNRGATVAPLTIDDLKEVVDVLSGLEAVVGRLAAARIDADSLETLELLHRTMLAHYRQQDRPAYFRVNQQIHLHLVEAARNRTLLDVYVALNLRIRRFRYLANVANTRWSQAVAEHEEIMKALRRRDGEALGDLLQVHLRTKTEHVLQSLRSRDARGAEDRAIEDAG